MSVKELNAKEQHYADTNDEAENIVAEAKEDVYLTSWKITEKHNKYGQYFVVDLQFTYNTPKEVMEAAESNAPDEPEDKGIEYELEDGAVKLTKEDE